MPSLPEKLSSCSAADLNHKTLACIAIALLVPLKMSRFVSTVGDSAGIVGDNVDNAFISVGLLNSTHQSISQHSYLMCD